MYTDDWALNLITTLVKNVGTNNITMTLSHTKVKKNAFWFKYTYCMERDFILAK